MKNISKADFIKAINTLDKGDGDGVIYQTLTTLDDGRDLCIVFGYTDGYDDGEKYQKRIGDKIYTLCAKIAINIDDLQCDFEADWYMPYTYEGDIADTCEAIDGTENQIKWFNDQAKQIAEDMNSGALMLE